MLEAFYCVWGYLCIMVTVCLDQGLAGAAPCRGELIPLAVSPGMVMSLSPIRWGREPATTLCVPLFLMAVLPDSWLSPWGEERKQQRKPGARGGLCSSQGQEATGCDELPGWEWNQTPRSSLISTSGPFPAELLPDSGVAKAGVVLRDKPGPDATCPAAQQWDPSCDHPETLSADQLLWASWISNHWASCSQHHLCSYHGGIYMAMGSFPPSSSPT